MNLLIPSKTTMCPVVCMQNSENRINLAGEIILWKWYKERKIINFSEPKRDQKLAWLGPLWLSPSDALLQCGHSLTSPPLSNYAHQDQSWAQASCALSGTGESGSFSNASMNPVPSPALSSAWPKVSGEHVGGLRTSHQHLSHPIGQQSPQSRNLNMFPFPINSSLGNSS